MLDIDRFDEIVGGTHAQCLHAGLHTGVAGHQHDFAVAHHLGVFDQLHAVAVGQHEVEQAFLPRYRNKPVGCRVKFFAPMTCTALHLLLRHTSRATAEFFVWQPTQLT
jgi:hypothetical protein